MSEEETKFRGIENWKGSIKDVKGMFPKPDKPSSLEDMKKAVLDEAVARHEDLNRETP